MTKGGYSVREALDLASPVLHRGRREPDGEPVLLKLPLSAAVTPAVVASARREFELRQSLASTGIAQPIGFDDARAAIVFEDRPGELLSTRLASGPLPLDTFFRLALQIASTIGDLHRAGVICRNLHPRTILVDESNGGATIVDLSTASRLLQDTAADTPASSDPARLAYLSPEQTGRMNRVVDYRSDLYSFGAVCYAMLTAQPPFEFDDALKVIHGHIARTPPAPSDLVPAVPRPVSDVVMKLLAKTAERRYQSARGAGSDLERCAQAWQAAGRIEPFPLGEHDQSDRFTIPQHLYGRDQQIQTLLDTFGQTASGPPSLMLVAGYAGIGKTALVNEIHKPIVRQRGWFIAGKFDQLDRKTPYGAVVQALRALVRQVAAESDERLAEIRTALREALGANAGVMAAEVHELEWLLGPQAPPPPLGPAESRNRFTFVLQDFLGVFASPERPLVLFLDDLQWADSATLGLLPRVLGGSSLRGLLIIGAYRDNEVGAGHPLQKVVTEIREAGVRVAEVALTPLQLPDLEMLVTDALGCSAEAASDLARLVQRKTDGNPFFVTQFLRTLHEDGLLLFDEASRGWRFDLARIENAAITDNVVDLMTRRLRQLRTPTQQAVALGACIGAAFSLKTLAVVRKQSLVATAAELWEAIDEGLVLPTVAGYEQYAPGPEDVLASQAPAYAFLHDRVQQAADALIPPAEKQAVHLRVGRLLLAECGNQPPGNDVFDVVNHLNIGSDLMGDDAERLRLAELNLEAGQRAKASAAFRVALDYFEHGWRLMPPDRWLKHYALTLALSTELAESHYLSGNLDAAEVAFEHLLREARSPLEKAAAHRMRLVQYQDQARYAEALDAGRAGLALFGVRLPDDPTERRAALAREFAAIGSALGTRTIGSLAGLPVTTDAETRMIVSLLTAVWAPSYILGQSDLSALISARLVRLALDRGVAEDSAYGFVTHAITVGPVRGDHAAAYEWGTLALAVNDRLADHQGRAKIYQQFHVHVNLWRRPIQTSIPYAREATRSGLESGDFTYAGYGAFTESWAALFASRDLEGFVRDYTPTVALLRRIRMHSLADAQELLLNWARALEGRTADAQSLSYLAFDEGAYLSAYAENPFGKTFYFAAKLHLHLTFEAFDAAWAAAQAVRREAWTPPGTMWPVLIDFWGALAAASLTDGPDAPDRATRRGTLADAHQSLAALSAHCPENFRAMALVLSAELDAFDGEHGRSAATFDEAIDYARATDNVQAEALAAERCGRLWLARGRRTVAGAYLEDARDAYDRWGASAKVASLRRAHGSLFRSAAAAPPLTAPGELDAATALKAARAVAREIEIDKLLKNLVTLAVESGGGERGLLLLETSGQLVVVAEGSAAGDVVLSRTRLDERGDLCAAIARLAHRTGESVLVDDARVDPRWVADPYVAARQPRSIACVPIVHQGRRAGVFYLENNLAAQAFRPDRVEMLQILSAEAVIALENARLYEDMRQEVDRRSRAEEALRKAVAELNDLKDRLHAENVYLQEEIRTEHQFDEIVGTSPALLEALRRVERVAATESSVLISGETGSGKELFARAIHSRSARRDRPLVKVNCGAIPAGLVESELFGHVRGAFTGAVQSRTGRFELAHGGTIFLDEVGELPLDTQVKLLRVLQEREFEPVGSSRTVRVDVRVIAASNRDLEQGTREGRFRADLLYRLNVFPITVPPLRERVSDIPLIVAFLVSGLARKLGRPLEGFSRRNMDRLMNYPWPGNVRELQNVVERAAIVARGAILDLDGDPLDTIEVRNEGTVTLEESERRHIVEVLRATGGVVEGPRGAAGILGLHPNTLRSRIKRLGIQRVAHDAS